MSVIVPLDIRCGRCRGEFQSSTWQSLHVRRAPEAREDILAGTFLRPTCPHCGAFVLVEPTMLYTDFDRRQWFATLPHHAIDRRTAVAKLVKDGFRANMEVYCPPMVREWAPDFTIRVTFGLPSLREKILAFDHGLDDRVLELTKLWLMRDLRLGPVTADVRFYLDRIEGDTLHLVHSSPGPDATELVHTLAVPRSTYAHVRDGLGDREPDLGGDVVVDWRAAFCPDEPLRIDEASA